MSTGVYAYPSDVQKLCCCVPLCERWRGDRKGDPVSQYDVFICQEHWSLTSKTWRRRHVLFRRRQRYDLAARMFARLMKQAIERAAGL